MAYTWRVMDPPVQRRGGQRRPRHARIVIRLTDEALAYIDDLAKREERTRSDMVRILIQRGMETRK